MPASRNCWRPRTGPAWHLAEDQDVEYLSFPSISTGIYGYPVEEAAPIAFERRMRAP